ncbi:hypothetical protein [uncultured Spongiibacter sp.]|uniref:hypothetical protein n=1 Tax=Spongiibacter marinus TaxID=354246 RepID=UPI00258F0D25|nr:hypothetical protein [uncultured Spongiibacter sp.]
MNDVLPSYVLDSLRGHYALGVANAEAFYEQHAADEDSVTGALGQALARAEPIRAQNGFDEYLVQVSYRKVRGRGPRAPERLLGIDGIFQLEVQDQGGNTIARKGLTFQSKKLWKGKNAGLLDQVRKMEANSPGGIVIDFGPNGYKACAAKDVIASLGNRTVAEKHHSVRPLEQFLCHDFLECHVGRRGQYFDPETERLENWTAFSSPLVHVLTTTVKKSRWG